MTEKPMIVSPVIVIAAGGTGGHIFPAKAVATVLQERDYHIEWVGAATGLETQLVKEYPLHLLPVKGLRKRSIVSRIAACGYLVGSVIQAYVLLRRLKPRCVLAMGGYPAVPSGLAAKLLGIPLLIHEQNAAAGLSNRLLARIATRVLAAFPDAFPKRVHAEVVGNPVRESILAIRSPVSRYAARSTRLLRILVIGGSQGAIPLNTWVLKALETFAEKGQVEIWHQTGERDLQTVKSAYHRLHMTARVESFVAVDEAFAWADAIVCRAGAGTVSEVWAVGIPAFFVPYPGAVDDHQFKNAMHLVNQQAAYIARQKDLSVEQFHTFWRSVLYDVEKWVRVLEASRKTAVRDSTALIVNMLAAMNGGAESNQ